MTTCQNYCIVALFVVIFAIALILTTLAPDMMIYDEGNVYSCPVDHMNGVLAKKYEEKNGGRDDEGKGY